MSKKTYCGYIAIVGRPNVGKSTLLNCILGQKISITARKPQTTRHNILGIKTVKNIQSIYVDTPGFHKVKKRALSRYMLKAIKDALLDVVVVVLVGSGLYWQHEDELILQKVKEAKRLIILAVNKADRIKQKERLLPYIQELSTKFNFSAIVPLSAKTGDNVEALEKEVGKLLPAAVFYFDKEQVTDRSERFLVAEIIREKLTRLLGHELPHELTVEIEKFTEEKKIINIAAVIYVERPGQKIIIIGKKGEKLKDIATKARIDMEKMLGRKVFLQLWVKVKTGWSDDEKALRTLGYR